ncbi:MAG: rod shape-determining protein RodA [Spirochaetaceae bacterium]
MANRSRTGFDVTILGAFVTLVTIGILFVYSSGVTSSGELYNREYLRQVIWGGTGLVLLVAVAFLDYQWLRRWSVHIFIGSLVLLVVTLMFGRVVNGARSWLGIGSLGIQPSEFAKISVVIAAAWFLERQRNRIHELPVFLAGLGIAAIPAGLTLLQPDLGTALVFIPLYLAMAYIAGARTSHVIYAILIAGLAFLFTVLPIWDQTAGDGDAVLAQILRNRRLSFQALGAIGGVAALSGAGYLLLKRSYLYWLFYVGSALFIAVAASFGARAVLRDYQIMRLVVFIDPYVEPRGAGWNIIQSTTAIGSGGVVGKGFLQGTHSHYQYLPQQSTDFIFSILAEEWGFLGAVFIFIGFFAITLRGVIAARNAKDLFGAYIASGVVALFLFHFFVNIGMTIGVMPITGIPLLLLSHGGSSLWTASIGLGLLISIHGHRFNY